jgi:hypothetical protein
LFSDEIHASNLTTSNVTTSNLDVNGDMNVLSENARFASNLLVGGMLSVEGGATFSNLYTSNITVTGGSVNYYNISNITLISEVDDAVSGTISVSGDLSINGKLFVGSVDGVGGTEFPMNPESNDISKVIGINSSSNYELMTLFHSKYACEFKSLFGKFQTGVELTHFSGLFDFGVPTNWLSGWDASLFEGGDSSSQAGFVIPSLLNIVEKYDTSNMDFRDFLNISMVKPNGMRMGNVSGISVYDSSSIDLNNPQYHFLLGQIDPNNDHFKFKFKNDFDTFYGNFGNANYGYSVLEDSVTLSDSSLHTQGTNMFVIEFINTYNKCPFFSAPTDNKKFRIPESPSLRASNYYLVDNDVSTQKSDGQGLFPYITYRNWRNSTTAPLFYEYKYPKALGWCSNDVISKDSVFDKHHANSNLKKLFKYTYTYILRGKATSNLVNLDPITQLTDINFEEKYSTIFLSNLTIGKSQSELNDSNIHISSNINSNMNCIPGNINSISLNPSVFSEFTF